MRRAYLLVGAAVALGGCGGGDDEDQGPPATAQTEAQKPTGPRPDPVLDTPEARAALAAGIKACAGKSPEEIKEEFLESALAQTPPQSAFRRVLEGAKDDKNTLRVEPENLSATIYGATLSPATRQDGFNGCLYGLGGKPEDPTKPLR